MYSFFTVNSNILFHFRHYDAQKSLQRMDDAGLMQSTSG